MYNVHVKLKLLYGEGRKRAVHIRMHHAFSQNALSRHFFFWTFSQLPLHPFIFFIASPPQV